MGNEEAFFSRCSEAFFAVSKMHNPLIVHHYDCDGITSASIIASWFEEQKLPYRMLCLRKLDSEKVKSLKNEDNIIFSDLGSGTEQIDELKNNVVVIDHHQPNSKCHIQVNPHFFSFDGGRDISSSGCAFFVFRCSVDLGIVGAFGDIQYPFISLNQKMLDIAIHEGKASITKDILLFGKNSRPLVQFLSYADSPYLPGLTGNDEECLKMLNDLAIPLKENEKFRTYHSLSFDEKKQLVSALAERLSFYFSTKKAESLVGDVVTLLSRPASTEQRDASEFSTLLNACGRNGREELGVRVCLSKPLAYEEAQLLLSAHRRNLREGIEFAVKNAQDLGKFILIDARGVIQDSIIGVVAGMLYPGGRTKPVLALSLEESGSIKLSVRGTHDLVKEGQNLGKILSECCKIVGGAGGGHNIAAGATIPNDKLDMFLKEFAKLV